MWWLLLSCLFLQATLPSDGLSFEKFVTVTKEQKHKLGELSSRVGNKVPHDYMKKDIYLLLFLRDVDFDVAAAEKKILSFIEWRSVNNIDNVLAEDFPEYDAEYRVIWEGCDKGGNPVISLPVGDWDLRRVVVAGNSMLQQFKN